MLAIDRVDALGHERERPRHQGLHDAPRRSAEIAGDLEHAHARELGLEPELAQHPGLAEAAARLDHDAVTAAGDRLADARAHQRHLALAAEDSAAFHLHAGLAAKHLRSTGAAALAAVAERVLEAGSASTSAPARRIAAEISDDVTSLSQLATSHEPEPAP